MHWVILLSGGKVFGNGLTVELTLTMVIRNLWPNYDFAPLADLEWQRLSTIATVASITADAQRSGNTVNWTCSLLKPSFHWRLINEAARCYSSRQGDLMGLSISGGWVPFYVTATD
jgi:hypothetical protein